MLNDPVFHVEQSFTAKQFVKDIAGKRTTFYSFNPRSQEKIHEHI